MMITIDPDELNHLKNFAFQVGNEELKTNCQMLLYYAKLIHNYYKNNYEYLIDYHCLRNPVIYELDWWEKKNEARDDD